MTRLWAKTPCPHQVRAPSMPVEFGAVPAVASFDVVDPSFGSGAPFDLVAEGSAVLELATCGTGFALAGDRDVAHTEFVQVAVNRCLAVAPVGGDCAWGVSGAVGDPLDRPRPDTTTHSPAGTGTSKTSTADRSPPGSTDDRSEHRSTRRTARRTPDHPAAHPPDPTRQAAPTTPTAGPHPTTSAGHLQYETRWPQSLPQQGH